MAESDYQLYPLIYALDSLKAHFRKRQDVYVAGDMFFYYERGKPASVVAPDVFVVIGADKHLRDSYLLWNEPKVPDFVLEITSHSTRSRDQGIKKVVYESLGVTEYFCFDPTFDYLDPPLCGYRLRAGRYEPITPSIATPAHVVLESQTLGLSLQLLDGEFRIIDPQTGLAMLDYEEALEQRNAATLELDATTKQRDAAAKQRDAATQQRDAVTKERDAAAKDRDAATKERDAATKDRDIAQRRGAEEQAARLQAEARLRELEAKFAALSGGRDDGRTSGS